MITATALATQLGIARGAVLQRAHYRRVRYTIAIVDGSAKATFTPAQAAVIAQPPKRGPKNKVKLQGLPSSGKTP